MNHYGWHKYVANLVSMCCSYTLNTQVFLYHGHVRHFDDRKLDILGIHHIKFFIPKAGDYMHDEPNDNGPKMEISNLYGNAKINWMKNHRTLKCTSPQMSYVIVEISHRKIPRGNT